MSYVNHVSASFSQHITLPVSYALRRLWHRLSWWQVLRILLSILSLLSFTLFTGCTLLDTFPLTSITRSVSCCSTDFFYPLCCLRFPLLPSPTGLLAVPLNSVTHCPFRCSTDSSYVMSYSVFPWLLSPTVLLTVPLFSLTHSAVCWLLTIPSAGGTLMSLQLPRGQ